MSEVKTNRSSWLLVALWLSLCGLGFGVLHRHWSTPGIPAAPLGWPADSGLRRAAGRGTLLVFVHPRCPCTRATVDSLAWIMARAEGRLSAYALFYRPREFTRDWDKEELWRAASAIPGLTVVADGDGREAGRFGAETSGQALYFDASGKILYRGGLTAGRGHYGDSRGRQAVLALASGRGAAASAPVFGCSLLSAEDKQEGGRG